MPLWIMGKGQEMKQDLHELEKTSPGAGSGVPIFDPARHYSRQGLIATIHSQWTPEIKALLIEAQAGQGKTSLALELLNGVGSRSAWCQLGSEHGDPVRFLEALQQLFKASLPDFSSPLFETMLAHGEIAAPGASDALEHLLQSVKLCLRRDFYLVLDDVYLLDGFPLSLGLIKRLLLNAPARLKLVLISRTPILAQLQANCPAQQVLQIGNADLALKRSEIAALFNDVLQLPIATGAVQTLHQVTEGWIMGMMLVASKAEASGLVVNNQALSAILAHGREGLPDYFIAEVLSKFSPALRRTLAKLALLQEIPLALAQQLSEVEDVAAVLNDLQLRNFFVRVLDGQKHVFVFHHLFQDCLRRQLADDFSRTEIEQLHVEVAGWYLAQNEYEKALGYYLRGSDYSSAQQLLQNVGMTLHAHNRIVTLQSALSLVSEEVLGQYPWLAYFRGIVALSVAPPSALSWFEQARAGFCASGDELGELMALVQILHYHMAVDSRHNMGRIHLQRASELFSVVSARLSPSQLINAANMLLLSHSVINNDIEKANQFYETGLKLVLGLDQKNLEAETRLARCYRNIFLGDHQGCRLEIEQSLALLASPRVNAINKAMLLLAHLNLVVNEADHDSYEYRKRICREALGEELFDKSIIGAYVRLWDIDMYFAQGKTELARVETEKALAGAFAGMSAHLKSQYLQYQAYLLALDGQDELALTAARESRALRTEVGCPFFESFNAALIGASYAQLGLFEEAEALYAQGLSRTDVLGAFYARPTLLAHRIYGRLLGRHADFARDDLRELLGDLRSGGFRQLWLCTSQVMQRLLVEAVRAGIEVEYARKIAAERYEKAILDDGSLIPLLKFHALGRLEVEFDGKIILQGRDLTSSQRQLLGLLLTAPNQQLHQEEIQAELWPEGSASRSRSNFDNALSRLRKTLDAAIGSSLTKHYLVLQKGVLRLANCRIDASVFAAAVKQGLAHCRRQEVWQADNVLRKALGLWQGELLPGVALSNLAENQRHDLLLDYLAAAQQWGQILVKSGRNAQAMEICAAALRYEPTSQELNRMLYNLYVTAGDNLKARNVFAHYSAALQRHGFESAELAEILEGFWADSV